MYLYGDLQVKRLLNDGVLLFVAVGSSLVLFYTYMLSQNHSKMVQLKEQSTQK